MKRQILFLLIALAVSVVSAQTRNTIDRTELPEAFANAIGSIQYDNLNNLSGTKTIEVINANTVKVKIAFDLTSVSYQSNWQLDVSPTFQPTYNWSPHLTPGANNIIDQHVFRSPVLILSDASRVLILIPDLDIMKQGTPVRWYMDMDAPAKRLTLGMSNSRVSDHILFERSGGATYPAGKKVEVGFYLMLYSDAETIANPFRKPLEFFWQNWGHDLYQSGEPLQGDLLPFVQHTYNWAFNTWKESVWQQFSLNGKTVGAPVFIANVTQSPNYPGEINEREFRSIWNQAWFSSLRSASGLYRYARRTNNAELLEKANMTKELALLFPKVNGFFYGLIGTEMHNVNIGGKNYWRSKGWDTYYWGNSNRNPYQGDAKLAPFHILDMSWTALLMLRWYDELEKDERLLTYAEDYAKALIKLQDEKGYFPGWLRTDNLEVLCHLNDSPETSMSVTFLLKLYQLTEKEEYKTAALKGMSAVMEEIIPNGRWEDFETYWSCSRFGSEMLVGRKVERNNMHKQNNFSMFWTAEALLESYRITNNQIYLNLGQRTIDELLMTQASWQPPYIYVKALGGFGVLNADGEWNDSRESLFAELILQYGKELNRQEYTERGFAALRASFVMMYCPENPVTKLQWEKVHPFFGEADYGFTMENYGHGGRTSTQGEGMGEFTIYDWGNGAAAEAYNRILDKFGTIN